jgi:putative DNA primase/helicase
MVNPTEDFKMTISTYGLQPPDVIIPGDLQRFPGQDKKQGNNAGWCRLFEDLRGGVFGDFSTGLDEHWQVESEHQYSEEERKAFTERIKAEREARDAELLRQYNAVSIKATEMLSMAEGDPDQHPYALKKVISLGTHVKRGAWPQRGWDDALLIPIYGEDGKIWTLEAINPAGDKDFLKGGCKRGGFYPLGKIRDANRVLVGEGLATVAAVHAVDAVPAVAAMDAGNLSAVALAVRSLAADAEIILLADNDIKEDGSNPGLHAAIKAAELVNGQVAIPVLNGQKCDFWDVWRQGGEEAVRLALSNSQGFATVTVATLATDKANNSPWPEPQPLTAKIEAQPYPIWGLPDIVREAVEEVVAFVKAPLPLVASSALGALSLAIQAHCDIKRAERLTGPVGLFLLSIADSGERKTSCDGYFTSAIREYEAEQAELSKPLLADYASEIAAWEAERGGLLAAIKEAGKKGKDASKQQDDLRELDHNEPEPPKIPRLILGDETPENMAYTLAKNWPSAGVISSEAGVIFGAHGMGKDAVMRNLGLLNILWDGGSLSIGRRSSESFTVEDARLTVALQIQEATLRAFFSKSDGLARGTGFLARFLVAWPESTQGFRPFTDPPDTWPKLAAFNRRISAILNTPVELNDQGNLQPTMLALTPEAKTAWVAFHDELEGALRTGGKLYDVRDVASKSADNAVRLAALFHAFMHNMDGPVDIDSFEGASQIAAWHLSEAKRFLGELALPEELTHAVRLDDWLIDRCKRNKTNTIPRREAQRSGPVRKKDALNHALQELEDLDRVRVVPKGRKKDIHINPALLVRGE